MEGNGYLIDIHAHIVFGVDDGARSLEESLKLIEMAVKQGVRAIIATPHNMPNLTCEEIFEKVNILNEKLKEESIECSIYTGQEIFYSKDTIDLLKKKKYLTLADSNYILVEFDPEVTFNYMKMATREMIFSGYIPIFAHVERYSALRKIKRLEEIRDMGALFQMNYGSLKGGIFNKNACWCKRQIKEGNISFMATDMHRIDSREPKVTDALSWISNNAPKYLKAITYDNAKTILQKQNGVDKWGKE